MPFIKGYIPTREHKTRIGESNKGKKRTLDTIKKLKIAHLGKKHSESTKRKIGEANKIAQKGKHPTEKTREKMRVAATGRKHTKKSLQKMRENRLGKHHTEETKQKISKTKILYPNKKFSNTSIERKIATELIIRHIPFKQNVGVEKIANVDFLLNNKIIIQCDGCYWHGCKKHHPEIQYNRKKDKKQDGQLKKLGYKIYRFWEHSINKSPEKCISKLTIE